jgi:hypothetical protein
VAVCTGDDVALEVGRVEGIFDLFQHQELTNCHY